jgi:uncharacterized membrane protein YoaK (UPF0700 family)
MTTSTSVLSTGANLGLKKIACALSANLTRDGLLVALTLGSGAVDAISVLGLGKVFTAFMTGNLVSVGERIAGGSGTAWVRLAIVLGAFIVGVLTSTLIVNPTRGSGVWPRRVTAALSISMAAQAVFFGIWLAVSGRPSVSTIETLLGFSALAMGVQTAAVFSLGVQGVFTTAATATLTVLTGDAAQWAKTRPDRRLLARILLALIGGAVSGAVLIYHARDYAPLVPLTALTFVVAAAAIAFDANGHSRRHGPQTTGVVASAPTVGR